MDPDEALAQIREVLAKPGPDAYADLATLVDGLDGWLSRGGFLPKAWADDREAAARAKAWEEAADLADTQIVLWSGVPGLHPTEPEPHPAAIAAAGARRTLTVLRSRMSEAFNERVAREVRP